MDGAYTTIPDKSETGTYRGYVGKPLCSILGGIGGMSVFIASFGRD
jgi:hypothetical protein